MPIKIKVLLTFYIIIFSAVVIFFEFFFGNPNLIYILLFITFLMTAGIWIFPEVVTKNNSNVKYKESYNE
jgi:hypothetical protein